MAKGEIVDKIFELGEGTTIRNTYDNKLTIYWGKLHHSKSHVFLVTIVVSILGFMLDERTARLDGRQNR